MKALAFLLNQQTEELGEVLQVIGKINRFGLDSRRPGTDENGEPHKTNRELLVTELNDVEAAVRLLRDYLDEDGRGGLPGLGDEQFIAQRMDKFMHFATVSANAGFLEHGDTPTTTPESAFDTKAPVTP